MGDYDNDGDPDVYLTNFGANRLLRNNGNGTFTDVTLKARPQRAPRCNSSKTSRGAAFDVDNDGDVDVLVTNNAGPVRLLLNETEPRRPWLQVRLEGVDDNRDGLGARVGLVTRSSPILWRRAHTDGSYLSSSDARVHFGLPSAADVAGIIVEWPRGLREMWNDVPVNRIVDLKQGIGRKQP